MNAHPNNSRALRAALRALSPVFVLTPTLRPRLLIAAALAEQKGTILFGVLVHRQKQAFQSRLRLDYPTVHQEALRATRWTPLTDPEAFSRYLAQVREGFEIMAATLGAQVYKVEFAPTATDEEIRAALHDSGILEVLRS
jgi:hypothetical protein